MKQHWNEQELVEHWTLTDSDKQLLDQRTERGRLGLAVLLKFFQAEGRFPLHHKEGYFCPTPRKGGLAMKVLLE